MMHEVVKIGLRQLPPKNRRILLDELDKGTEVLLNGDIVSRKGIF